MTSPFKSWRKKVANEGVVIGTMPSSQSALPPMGEGVNTPLRPMEGQQLLAFLSTTLEGDLATLSGIASIKQKIAHKRDVLLDKYAEYVERLQASNMKHELIGYYLVWLFDAGDIAGGMKLGKWCMENGHSLPERFTSDVPFFIAWQVVDWADGELKNNRSFEPYVSEILEGALAHPEQWNLTDQLMGGLYRLKGLEAEQLDDLNTAADYLQKAFDLGAKVATKLKDVQKRLERQAK